MIWEKWKHDEAMPQTPSSQDALSSLLTSHPAGTGIYMIVTAFVADSVSDELQAAILAIPCLVSFLLCLVLL